MTIHPLPTADLPAALRLSTQAGWNHAEADLRRLLALWPGGYFGGYLDGKLIATTTLATYGAHFGWVGLVLVDEAYRRRGFAGQMLDAMLEAAEAMGVKTLGLDATELGRPLYLARGFRDVATIDRWVRPPEIDIPPAYSPAQKNAGFDPRQDASAWTGVLQTDLRATRVDRSILLNHFRHESDVVCRSLRQTTVEPSQGHIMMRPGRMGRHIAPVIANSEGSAEAMLDLVVASADEKARSPVFIDVPSGRLENWLSSRGFRLARSIVRMQAGIRGPDLLGSNVFAGCGFELG